MTTIEQKLKQLIGELQFQLLMAIQKNEELQAEVDELKPVPTHVPERAEEHDLHISAFDTKRTAD